MTQKTIVEAATDGTLQKIGELLGLEGTFCADYGTDQIVKAIKDLHGEPEIPPVRKPFLFYYEEAENAFIPAPDHVENIIDLDSMVDREVVTIQFRRHDMTDEEYHALPES